MYKYESHNSILIYYGDDHWHQLTDDSIVMNFMADKTEQIKFLIVHKSLLDKSSIKRKCTKELLEKLNYMHAIIHDLNEEFDVKQ